MRIYEREILLSILCYEKNYFFLAFIKKRNTIEYFVEIKKYFSGYNVRMLEIAIDSSYKFDLETINDPINSQYFWIIRRDLEFETKRNW